MRCCFDRQTLEGRKRGVAFDLRDWWIGGRLRLQSRDLEQRESDKRGDDIPHHDYSFARPSAITFAMVSDINVIGQKDRLSAGAA